MAALAGPLRDPGPHMPRSEHGTCVCIGARGILILGPSGAGKSTLALKLILDAPRCLPPAELVADDRVMLDREGEVIAARPAPQIAGLIEVRGLGIRRLPYLPRAELAVLVDLDPGAQLSRMPNMEAMKASLHGCTLQRIAARSPEEGAFLLAALLSSADYQN